MQSERQLFEELPARSARAADALASAAGRKADAAVHANLVREGDVH